MLQKIEQITVEDHPFFSHLSDDEKELVDNALEEIHFKDQEIVFREHDTSDDLYYITDGTVQVIKDSTFKNEIHIINEIPPHQFFGEMSFLDDSPRSATIRAGSDVTCIQLKKDKLKSLGEKGEQLLHKIMVRIAVLTTHRIREGNKRFIKKLEDEVHLLNETVNFGKLTVGIFLSFSISMIVNRLLLTELSWYNFKTHTFSWVYTAILLFPLLVVIFSMKQKLSSFGVSLSNWRLDIKNALKYSIPLFLMFLSIAIVWHVFIHHRSIFAKTSEQYMNWGMIGYIPHSYIQEFIFRGVFQNTFQRFFRDIAGWKSILVTSLLFGMLHIHMGITGSMLTFLAGIFFGWIYLHTQSLICVSTVHFILGFCVFLFGLLAGKS